MPSIRIGWADRVCWGRWPDRNGRGGAAPEIGELVVGQLNVVLARWTLGSVITPLVWLILDRRHGSRATDRLHPARNSSLARASLKAPATLRSAPFKQKGRFGASGSMLGLPAVLGAGEVDHVAETAIRKLDAPHTGPERVGDGALGP
jgi:hypothetical protein